MSALPPAVSHCRSGSGCRGFKFTSGYCICISGSGFNLSHTHTHTHTIPLHQQRSHWPCELNCESFHHVYLKSTCSRSAILEFELLWYDSCPTASTCSVGCTPAKRKAKWGNTISTQSHSPSNGMARSGCRSCIFLTVRWSPRKNPIETDGQCHASHAEKTVHAGRNSSANYAAAALQGTGSVFRVQGSSLTPTHTIPLQAGKADQALRIHGELRLAKGLGF